MRRLFTASGGFVMVLLVVALAGWWNPWNLVRLRQIGEWALWLLPLGVGLLLLRRARWRLLLAVVVLGAAGVAWLFDEPGKRTVVGSSTDGRYQIVVVKSGDGLGERQEVKVVRPAGWDTRESQRPLLCARAEFNDAPPMQYAAMAFTGPYEVELTLTDGARHRIGFDPRTAEPKLTLDVWCHLKGAGVRSLA
ncbi:hypothetical protein ACQP00_23020 [Dactylosporangium sp. CS-047395]|uniref:hypothetical protein n=1 Tax=Dactylosporangium sp. CS-047395 TaxID=3239936 RepID=UPI003D9099A8